MAPANLVRIKPSVIELQKGKKKTTYYLGYPTNTWISFIVSHEYLASGDTYNSCMIDWSSRQYIVKAMFINFLLSDTNSSRVSGWRTGRPLEDEDEEPKNSSSPIVRSACK